MSRVLVLDNGSYNIKVGYATQDTPYVVPNCVVHSRHNKRSSLVGSQFTYANASNNNINNSAIDYSGLVFQRPHERGQLVDWRLEFGIWNSIFAGKADKGTGFVDPIDPTETSLILTEAPVSLPQVSANTDQMVFEEYGFKDYYRCTSGSLVPWNDFDADLNGPLPQTTDLPTTSTTTINDNQNNQNDETISTNEIAPKKPALSECALVIDSGFHATNVLPTILGEVYWPAAQQISVGGRLLTNYLREIVSFQQFNMMEETFLINSIKERTCFVATDFEAELAKCKRYKMAPSRAERDANPYLINYALPESPGDIGHIIKKAEDANTTSGSGAAQTLRLSNERFSVPELLFSPHHVGLDQAGLAETVANCLNRVPVELQSLFAANIVLVGGSAKFPGLAAHLERELIPLLPDTYHLRVRTPAQNPELYAWQGGRRLARQDGMLEKVHVTREEYMEYGEKICAMKFNMKRLDTEGGAGSGDGSNYDSSDMSE